MRGINPMMTITDEPAKLANHPAILKGVAKARLFLMKHGIPKALMTKIKEREEAQTNKSIARSIARHKSKIVTKE